MSKRQKDDRWAGIPFAALQLKVSRQTVYAMIARGDLDGAVIAGRQVVDRKSLAALVKEQRVRAT